MGDILVPDIRDGLYLQIEDKRASRGNYHMEVIEPNKLVKSGGKECWWVLFACILYLHGSHVHVSLGADAVLR